MPRRATGPTYYPSRRGYYVWHQGRQHRLAAGPEGGVTLQRAWAAYWELMRTPLRQILNDINDPIRVAAEVRERLERLPKDAEALERVVRALGMTNDELAECMPVSGLPDVEEEVPDDAWTRRRLGGEDYRHEYGRRPTHSGNGNS